VARLGAGSACLPVAGGDRRDGIGLEDVDAAHGPLDRATAHAADDKWLHK
jgi:hypothetical protein